MPLRSGEELLIPLPGDISGNILIESAVINSLQQFCQLSPDAPESGGCLLGHYRPPHIHITGLTTPMKKDKQSRVRFERRDKNHIRIINDFTKKTKTGTYIGEWHTHPEPIPSPSFIDKNGWNNIFSMRTPTNSIFIIVGITHISTYLM
jgi:integrative and conjugative element protein (TIGR02256 family)